MALTWADYRDVAEALNAAHPGKDILKLKRQDVLEHVRALPGFDGAALPSNMRYVDAITYAWIRAQADEDDLGTDEGPSWA